MITVVAWRLFSLAWHWSRACDDSKCQAKHVAFNSSCEAYRRRKEKLRPVFYCPKSGQIATLLAASPSFCFKEVTLISLPGHAVLRSNTLDLLKFALLKLSTVPALSKVKEEIYESWFITKTLGMHVTEKTNFIFLLQDRSGLQTPLSERQSRENPTLIWRKA